MVLGFNNKKKGYGFGVGMPGFGMKKNSISSGNWDKDRKPNRGDCDAFNWKKQDGGEPFVKRVGKEIEQYGQVMSCGWCGKRLSNKTKGVLCESCEADSEWDNLNPKQKAMAQEGLYDY